MDIKKHFKSLVAVFLIITVLTKTVSFIIRYGKPDFQNELIENFNSNTSLKLKIGDYQNHEFSYPTNELELDSLHFQLIIFGSKKSIIYTGCAKKIKNGKWKISRINQRID